MINVNKLKVGDKVRRIVCSTPNMEVGEEGVVEGFDGAWVQLTGSGYGHNPAYLEVVEEKQVFDLKTQPWKIYVNNAAEYNATQEWLKDNFGSSCTIPYFEHINFLTNVDNCGNFAGGFVMWGTEEVPIGRHEIKLTFKTETTVDSIQYPTVESDKERKLRELKETAKKIQQQIEELGE